MDMCPNGHYPCRAGASPPEHTFLRLGLGLATFLLRALGLSRRLLVLLLPCELQDKLENCLRGGIVWHFES